MDAIGRLMTTAETAQMLAVQKKSLEIWRWQGRGPVHRKIGRLVRYAEADVLAWLEGQTRSSTSDKGAAS